MPDTYRKYFYKKELEALKEDDFSQVAAITLNYYDKAYVHGLNKRTEEQIQVLVLNTLDKNLQTDAVLAHPICQQSI